MQFGKMVTAWINIKHGTTGFAAGSGYVMVSLPVTAKTDSAWVTQPVGTGYVWNGASTYYTTMAGTDDTVSHDKCIVYTDTGLGTPTLSSGGATVLVVTYEAA